MNSGSKADVAPTTQTVNALLLRTFALLQTPLTNATLRLALGSADEALSMATRSRRFDLEPRAQLFRGHVLRCWGRWPEAWQAYIRAASVRGAGYSGTDIKALTRECLEMMRIQDEGDSERQEAMMKEKGARMVRFSLKEGAPGELCCDETDEAGSDEGDTGMYLLLNGSGESVSSRESLPDLRSVRGRGSVYRSTTPE